jgi:hypothetical protein
MEAKVKDLLIPILHATKKLLQGTGVWLQGKGRTCVAQDPYFNNVWPITSGAATRFDAVSALLVTIDRMCKKNDILPKQQSELENELLMLVSSVTLGLGGTSYLLELDHRGDIQVILGVFNITILLINREA